MSSKGSMGQDVFPDAPALPFGFGRRLWPKSGGPGLSALAPLLGLSSNLLDDLGLYGRALHLDLHCGVECPPGFPQLRGERRTELAIKAPHQRLAHCDMLRWLNAKSGERAT
jgi:hypothetical protein